MSTCLMEDLDVHVMEDLDHVSDRPRPRVGGSKHQSLTAPGAVVSGPRALPRDRARARPVIFNHVDFL